MGASLRVRDRRRVITVPRRRIVVVTYYHPPAPLSGARRWASMSRHLRRMGDDVTVVTSAIHGTPPTNGSIIRTGDLAEAAALRRLLRRPELPSPGAVPAQKPAPALLTKVLVPDAYVASWVPSALRAVRALTRANRIDCLITSGPPDSVHVLGLLLGRQRPPWIADFRDGWRFEPLRKPFSTSLQERLDAWLERRVASGADVVVGATRPIATDLAARLGANAHWVTNGFEPEVAIDDASDERRGDDGWRSLVHTGTLSGPRGRDPRPILAAVRAFNAERPDTAPRIRLVLAGLPSVADERLLTEAGLGDEVRHVGLLDRDATIRLQRGADALLLLTGTDRSEATAKLFEYLASGRPVIAVARDNEAERIVRETHSGLTVDAADSAALHAALRELADGSLERRYAPGGLEHYRYPGPAEAMSKLIDLARSLRPQRDARE